MCSVGTICYDSESFFTQKQSHYSERRECKVLERERLHDETYRWEVVAQLMLENGDAIAQFCRSWLSEGLAEEITQEVFVAAWENLLKYRPQASLRTWLFGIARHKCQQMYRNRARRREIGRTFVDEIHARAHAERPVSPDDLMAHASQEMLLADCMSRLRDEDRIVLTLRYWKEMPVDDIADVMGKSVAAIRKRLLRAQQRLKELMNG
jgi:RNA polymerase sigma-70 factor (ECF subfamily)